MLLITNPFVFLLIYQNLCQAKPPKFYCDFGICENEQSCCGYNKCCDHNLNFWYFWLGLGLVVMVVAFTLLFKYYRHKQHQQTRNRQSYVYSKLENT